MGALDLFRRKPPQTAAVVQQRQPDQLGVRAVESRFAAEAWEAYRWVGEVHYATNQQARLVGRLDWEIAVDGGEPMDTESSDALLSAAFGDNLRDMSIKGAVHLTVAGAYNLVRTRPNDNTSWQVFSSPPTARQKKLLGGTPTQPGADIIIEVRTEDPHDAARNDSPIIAALDTIRELILCRMQSKAYMRSRTAQLGMVLYPIEGVPNPDQFEADLQDTMVAPLADERSTATVTPNLVGFPGDLIDKWKTLDFTGDADVKLAERDAALVRSVAVQMDIPPEILLGFADSTHWNQWGIQEDNWLSHVEPLAAPIGRGYAAAITAAAGGDGAHTIAVTPDPSPLLTRRPTAADALAANTSGLVSDDWTREQIGAGENDAPAHIDPAVTIALELIKKVPAVLADPGLPALVAQIKNVMTGTPIPAADQPAPKPPAAAEPLTPSTASLVTSLRTRLALPEPVVAAPHPIDALALSHIDTQAYDSLEDLFNDTTDRTLERLGAKVRSITQDQPTAPAKDVTNAQAAVAYSGPIPNADHIIADTAAASLPRLGRVIDRAFARTRSSGVNLHQDPDDATASQALYTALLTTVVAARLAGGPTDALVWQAARRVAAVAGGSADPAPTAVAS